MRTFDDLLHAAGELTGPEREHIVTELIAGDADLQRWNLVPQGVGMYEIVKNMAREKDTRARNGDGGER